MYHKAVGTEFRKISFCTAIMNRLSHLRETLVRNIRDNADYPALEFVILDYNSQDGLFEWMKSEMVELIGSGRVIYAKSYASRYFHRSHAKNMAFRISNGEILCNVDADNFTGVNYAAYINEAFSENDNLFLTADYEPKKRRDLDTLGRVCCLKEHFTKVGGYDEQMSNYGWEDIDLYNRLKMVGIDEKKIESVYLGSITHSNEERIGNEYPLDNLLVYSVHYVSPVESEIICLFKDGSFHSGTLIPDMETQTVRYINIREKMWDTGSWKISGSTVFVGDRELILDRRSELLVENHPDGIKKFHIVKNRLPYIIMRHSSITNRAKLLLNVENKNHNPNNGKFGEGNLVVNLNPLQLTQL